MGQEPTIWTFWDASVFRARNGFHYRNRVYSNQNKGEVILVNIALQYDINMISAV